MAKIYFSEIISALKLFHMNVLAMTPVHSFVLFVDQKSKMMDAAEQSLTSDHMLLQAKSESYKEIL